MQNISCILGFRPSNQTLANRLMQVLSIYANCAAPGYYQANIHRESNDSGYPLDIHVDHRILLLSIAAIIEFPQVSNLRNQPLLLAFAINLCYKSLL